jgi:hypothetical protein
MNPYAAPKSKLLPDEPERLKRPSSVKWAICIMMLSCIGISILEYQLFNEHGWSLWTDHPLASLQDLFRFIALFALLFGGRRPWVYWATAVTLLIHIQSMLRSLFEQGVRILHDVPTAIAFGIFGPLLVYHFYRFVFCDPSRSYFKLAWPKSAREKP